MAWSKPFGILVTGIQDGSVVATLTADGTFLWAADVPAPPKRIAVTREWGFVVVDVGNSIILFGVNGERIREVSLTTEIAAMETWKADRGVDWVALADPRGDVFVCEAFYLIFGQPFCQCHAPVVAIAYNSATKSVIVVTEDGEVRMLPAPASADARTACDK
jgi:hypothetical protein